MIWNSCVIVPTASASRTYASRAYAGRVGRSGWASTGTGSPDSDSYSS